MKIRLNGEDAEVPEGSSVEQLLLANAVLPPRVAVQRNGSVVRRATYGETVLQEGDEIEIVSFFGGG